MNIHIFNPEHDLALAANNIFWTAPHAGRQLRKDLGWLPLLWAKEGDIVVVDDIMNAESAYRKIKNRTEGIHFVTLDKLSSLQGVSSIDVWGWDKSIVHQLKNHGIEQGLLPDSNRLDKQRAFSDRATSARMLSSLREAFPSVTIGDAIAVSSVEDILSKRHELGSIVIKAPWSSSGRGVRYLVDDNDNTIKWASKIIQTQGHIMIEPYLNKVKDFGMEFFVQPDGTVQYEGLSIFHTINNAYEGSIIATEKEKQSVISQYILPTQLKEIQIFIQNWLEKNINGCYCGPLGVDMMFAYPTLSQADDCITSSEPVLLQPCVEINLRRTMGHVALAISPKEDGHQQIMRIIYEGKNYHFRLQNDHEILF